MPKEKIAPKIAKGAALVAAAAGLVAAGAALGDEKTRNKVGKGAKNLAHSIQDSIENLQEDHPQIKSVQKKAIKSAKKAKRKISSRANGVMHHPA